jgi:hypothetical protein
MKRALLVALWVILLAFDGIVLPAIHSGPSGFGTIVFLIALILSFGTHRWVIGWGMAAAFCAELFFGFYLGALVGTWLVVVWAWQVLNQFFSLKSFTDGESSWFMLLPLELAGLVLFILAEGAHWLIIRLAYEHNLSFRITADLVASPSALITAGLELVVLLIIIRLLCIRRSFIYG